MRFYIILFDILSILFFERFFVFGFDVFDIIDYVERVFRDVVVFIVEDFFESVDGFFEGDKLIFNIGEDLSDSERLRYELLVIFVSFGFFYGLS